MCAIKTLSSLSWREREAALVIRNRHVGTNGSSGGYGLIASFYLVPNPTARQRARNRATFGRICSLAIKVFF